MVIHDIIVGLLLTEHPERVYAIMSQMGGRIRELTQDYLDACRAADEMVETKRSGKEKKRAVGSTPSLTKSAHI